MPRKPVETPSPSHKKAVYQVAEHRVLLSGRPGTWSVDVDESALPRSFATQAEAWEAGVREADRLDRLVAGQGPQGPAPA